MASPTIEEIAKRFRADGDKTSALVVERYITETDHLKNIVQAVVEDIGYAMKELAVGDHDFDGLRRCTTDLNRSVDEHTKVTESEYERNFRPRFNCRVLSLRCIDATKSKKGDVLEDSKMEMVVQFPAAEYDDSPHSLMPDQSEIYIMVKEKI
ncbi:hypothetical protein ACHAPT_004625 [Fusarium lateritium]